MHSLDIGLLGFILLALLASLAVKQLAHLLVYGSIFDWIRDGLKDGMKKKAFGAKTLHELFTCTLCMITQLTLWLIAVPLAAIAYYNGSVLPFFPESIIWQLPYATTFGILAALVVGAFATYFMFKVEYPSTRFKKAFDELNEAHLYIRELEAAGAVAGNPALSSEVFTRVHFDEYITAMDRGCAGISCRFARHSCRLTRGSRFLNQWAKREEASPLTLAQLGRRLVPVFQEYALTSGEYRSDQARGEFLDALYAKLFPMQAAAA
jgi:hypothetical protein